MRILHLTRDYPPRRNGGLSVAVPALVEAGRRFCGGCLVASFDAWRPRGRARAERIKDTADVIRLSGPDDLPRLRSRIAEHAPDLVHVHDAMLFHEAARCGARTVFHAHVLQAQLRRLRGLSEPTQSELAEARALADADWVIAPTGAAAESARPRRVSVVPFPVPLPASVEEGDGSALFVGRFADVKGLGELFVAIRRVTDALPDARFTIAGGLPDNPRSERRWRERFERTAPEVARAATQFVGWCDEPQLQALYRGASVLVVPSWTETFGLALGEGMAHGLAIVASDVPAIRERVLPPRDGVLVPPRDPEALAQALLGVMGDPVERKRLAAAARAAAERRSGPVHGALRAAYAAALES